MQHPHNVELLCAYFLVAAGAVAQMKPSAAAITGRILDPSDAVIPGASVVLISGKRDLNNSSTDGNGEFRFEDIGPGRYELRIECRGFAPYHARVNVGASAPRPLRIVMSIAEIKESLTVGDSDQRLDVSGGANADVIHLGPEQLADLPLMNGDVIAALSQLLGPSAFGSEGATVIVDGLPTTNARIPLSEIQEITINNSAYSAEFARPGRARVEIITKSGSSKYHGSLSLSLRNYHLDARNAFAVMRSPQDRRQVDANLSGPVHGNKANTFSLAVSRIDDRLEPSVYAFTLAGPVIENASRRQESTYASGQVTHRFGENAASFRYTHFDWSDRGEGAGGFVLPEAGSDLKSSYHQMYSSLRSVISAKLLNDLSIRLRIENSVTTSELPGAPKIVVLDAFTSGGSQANIIGTESRLDLVDVFSWSHGRQLLKAGLNVPAFSRIGSTDQSNFIGTFYFSTLGDYAAGRAFSFIQNSGNGHLVYWQQQVGGFVQDEIKIRPNLSLALGLRYDWQNYGSDYRPAPRLGFAWAPGKSQKTIVRGGAGFFYDTLPATAIADTLRLNGALLFRTQLLNPGYPDPFSAIESGAVIPPDIVRFDSALRQPYNLQYSIGLERQLRKKLTLTTTWTAIRGVDLFRSRDVNAPVPPQFLYPPEPLIGVLRQIEASGGLKSHSLQTTLRGNMSRFFSGTVIHEWGRATSDTNGINSFPANNWDPQGEWSRSALDTRNFLYVYGTFMAGKYFRLGVIFSANSGRPYTMITGRDDYHDGLANARPAGVPRNSLQGAGAATLDVRWSREFHFHSKEGASKDGPSLVTGLDAFNLFNRVNYSTFSGDLSSPFFGRPVAAAPARRVQASLAVRF